MISTKTWNCLTRKWGYYAEAKRKQLNGLELSDFDKKWLTGLPVWREELCISNGEVSFAKLRVAFESELLNYIQGIGPINLSFIQKVIADADEKLHPEQS